MRITGRAATAADVKQFYPELTASVRAWVCEIDGKAEGIIGIALLRPVACMFSTYREALRPHLRHPAVLRLIKRAQIAMRSMGATVWAAAEPDEPTATRILARLGFNLLGEFEGDVIYEWRPA